VAERDAIDTVHQLPGVVTVLDVEDDRVVDHRGVLDGDNLEIVLHFAGTWWELLGALLPVLSDALHTSWTPGHWWACAGGDYLALGRDGRAVLVESAAAERYLAALAGDGRLDGTRIW
jgi:roadblock/LC7 domain-containing protein